MLGYDQASGFGLVHALEPLRLPALPLGDSRKLRGEESVILAGGGGRAHAVAGKLIGRAPFAGYWEYQLDEALFTAPAHPHWSGAALIGPSGSLVGVGSLQMAQSMRAGAVRPINMCVPIELLPPILDDLSRGDRAPSAAAVARRLLAGRRRRGGGAGRLAPTAPPPAPRCARTT